LSDEFNLSLQDWT